MELRAWAVHVALPLAAGALVYLTCRRALPRALAWFPWGGRLAGELPAGFVGVFPDAAWAYSLAALQALLWRDTPGPARWFWMATAPLAAAGWELGQYARLLPGTFDPGDLVFGVAACGLAVLLCSRPRPIAPLPTPPKG